VICPQNTNKAVSHIIRTEMQAVAPLTAVQIPCCLCGVLTAPNAANQCASCLAQEFDLKGRLQRGPSGAPFATTYQCRECRRFRRSEKHHEHAGPESPELLAICLKAIPALQSTAEPRLHLIDAGWVWTEPHSMRWKVRLTVRTEIQAVTVQQRVVVELHNAFRQCNDCNREFTNRTWQALVQLRQKRSDDAPKKGLTALEMALAKNKEIRKHVLKIDAVRNGFDFYFLSLSYAQAFSAYLQRVGPMRVKTSKKLVSQDFTNNTANMKYTVVCDLVPFCKDDLVLIKKGAKGKLSGRLALVTKVSSVVHLMDSSPKREALLDSQMELSPDAYYKQEKLYTILQASNRTIPFVVLDVDLCQHDGGAMDESGQPLYAGVENSVEKYCLADVQVARQSDFGVNDEVFNCVTHLGHLIRPGDVVMGYDLVATVGGDWEVEESLHNSFVLPDVVLVKKIVGSLQPSATELKAGTTKKRERRHRRKEGKKSRELEESAARMGFLHDYHEDENEFETKSGMDPALAAELHELEKEFAALDRPSSERLDLERQDLE
jgi:nonsense-mediated mRNA decay protein 3